MTRGLVYAYLLNPWKRTAGRLYGHRCLRSLRLPLLAQYLLLQQEIERLTMTSRKNRRIWQAVENCACDVVGTLLDYCGADANTSNSEVSMCMVKVHRIVTTCAATDANAFMIQVKTALKLVHAARLVNMIGRAHPCLLCQF